MLVETILQIGAFNYKTGNITNDIENNWNKVYENKQIPKNIEITFERFLKYYYQMYIEHKSNLPQSKITLSIFLKEILIKKVIMNLNKETTYDEFNQKINILLNNLNITIEFVKDVKDLKNDFSKLSEYTKRMKLLEPDIDKILILLSNKLGIEDTRIYQKIEFRTSKKNVSRIEKETRIQKNEKKNKLEKKNESSKEQLKKLQQEYDKLSKLYEKSKEDYKIVEEINDKLRDKLDEKKQNKSIEKYENIKELIETLDDNYLDYPLSTLYMLNRNDEKDIKRFKARINDLFLALAHYGIDPYMDENETNIFIIQEKDICQKYRINKDISTEKTNKGKYSLPGWKYNGKPIILPLVELVKEKKEGIKDE